MKKVLILGGTRFFGKRLVQYLLQEGKSEITVATRGNTPLPFGEEVRHLIVDREVEEQLRAAAEKEEWDIVYDNICYSPDAAMDAVKLFDGRTKKYVFTSSLSVYDAGVKDAMEEEDFDPSTYGIQHGRHDRFTYQEGKRQAEAVFMQQASFPVVCVRFPIVLGTDDYTKRLHFHVDRIKEGRPIGLPNLNARMGFIHSEEAARFLAWAGASSITGPVNAASQNTISLGELMELIESKTGQKAMLTKDTEEDAASPFGVEASWYMNTNTAAEAGFEFDNLNDWLPKLVDQLALN
ncbi:NAD-dependent epimerase/dehydratase family protein [Paenibacillus urinalis]|uniref:NAD-dependent epimerase/dehydratase family protein n=1 Tax=Paenibacillus urinalis TaxID=521520 RepID=UPI0023681467|nr:NAD-dependent epimerase/dehydratase family protein [Paenibacillus urinalis]WDH96459.1 NAD-dependent epimerase/dehydratase family protein [Paenibacillus urinalis]